MSGGQMTTADQFGVLRRSFFQSTDMPLGNDQNMGGGLRIDVFKGEGMLILIDFLGWNLVAKDTAEQTIGHGMSKV